GGSITRRWNNNEQPIAGRRSPDAERISNFTGRMPLSAMPGYGPGKEGVFKGKLPISAMPSYGPGREGVYAGRMKARKPLTGGGSITRRWNNNEQPIAGRRSPDAERISNFTGKMPISAMPSYGPGREGVYTGKLPISAMPSYGPGREGVYAGRMKGQKPLKGGGSITRRWNNNEQPIAGRRSPDAERISNFTGKMPLSAMPSYGPGREGVYAGRMKARKPLKGGGSITRRWNNNEQPIAGRRSPDAERISNFTGKLPISAMPSYGPGREGVFAGNMKSEKPLKGGGSITRRWNNNEQPLARRRNPDAEKISNFTGKMPLSAMPGYGKDRMGVYAGNLKAKKPVKGGGSITQRWNNDEQPITRSDVVDVNFDIQNYKGNLPAYLLTGYGPSRGAVYKGDRKYSGKTRQSPGTERGRTRSFTFLRMGDPTHMGFHEEIASTNRNRRLPDEIKGARRNRTIKSPGTERGRTVSLSFVEILDPRRGGLHNEYAYKKQNRKLPPELSRKERMRIVEADGMRNGRAVTFSFWALGDPTQGGLLRAPAQAKGRLHPSSTYTKGYKSKNSLEEKEKPVKIKIWWAMLFKKNANQPKATKTKSRRPRYDKDERSIWETAERPNWYNN
ncbi:MAG: hypothetical protein R3356_04120, partial [Eudoraea sp.]|nr:hypothetical protein [Eudoraea sp.]